MALTVQSAAETKNLTTVAAVKKDLAITDDDQDEVLADYIGRVSDAVRSFTNRSWARETYVETVKGSGTSKLILARRPIVSVSSVLDSVGQAITDYTIEDPDAGLLYRKNGWTWAPAIGWRSSEYVVPGSDEPNFTVTYIAGYILPGFTSGEANLPRDVEDAVIEEVKERYRGRRSGSDERIKSRKIGGTTITFDTATASGLQPHVEQMLKPWVAEL